MNFKNRQAEDLEVNVTPLIDVVFLLLIFFMITTTFQKETELQINLPEASADESQDKDRPLEIVVDARGRFFVDGKELLNSSPDTLRAAVQKVTVGNKDRHVVIRGDGQADYQAVVTIMDVIGKLGLVKMSLSTSETAGK
jgi:biopolymer transport protein ExbD